MAEREKSFIRKAIESLALKLIIFIAALVGTAVLGWYTANSAWFHGIPGYKLGLIIAAVFALSMIGAYFLILAFARIPLRNAPAGSLLEPKEHWLLELAEKDRLELHRVVLVVGCAVYETLTGDDPHVLFDFYIHNGSIFAITIDSTMKGFISLNENPLRGPRIASSLPHNLQRGWGDHFRIRQELRAADVAKIAELDAAMPEQGFYDFGNLLVTIRGNSPTTDAQARLQFRRVTRRRINHSLEWV